jgi:hypothetical protein
MTPKPQPGGFAADLNDLERIVNQNLLPIKDHLEGLIPRVASSCDGIVNGGSSDWVDPNIVLEPLRDYLRLISEKHQRMTAERVQSTADALRATVDLYRQVDGS